MGQNETKAAKLEDCLKLLRALLKASGVKTSKKAFAQLHKYIRKYCHWLPPQGTLTQADWDNVLRGFKKAHRRGCYPCACPVFMWSDHSPCSLCKLPAVWNQVRHTSVRTLGWCGEIKEAIFIPTCIWLLVLLFLFFRDWRWEFYSFLFWKIRSLCSCCVCLRGRST